MKTAEKQESVVRGQGLAEPGQVRNIPLEKLEANSRNPRRTMDDVGLRELAASIREHGIQVPLLVRCAGNMGSDEVSFGMFEIIAGHRRCEAATIAGLSAAPCIVRDLDDATAAEIALIDNLQRVDVPAMEEAEAFGELLEVALSIEAVAAKVGKETGYVAKSLKLLSATEPTRNALRAGLLTIDHVRLLVRVAAAEQNEALKWCLDTNAGIKKTVESVISDLIRRRNDTRAEDEPGTCRVCGCTEGDPCDLEDGPCSWANAEKTLCSNPDCKEEDGLPDKRRSAHRHAYEAETVQRLKEHIQAHTGTPLSQAPWPMDEDHLLPDAGSCLDCPKNTRANSPLFGDMEMGVAVCTDGACFKAKTAAFIQVQGARAARIAAGIAGQPPVPGSFEPLRVSWKATTVAPRMCKPGICLCKNLAKCQHGTGPVRSQLFKHGQWIEATAACEFATDGVTVDWSEAGYTRNSAAGDKLRKPGELLRVCIQPKCKAHPKAYEKAKAAAQRDKPEDPAAAAKRRESEAFIDKVETEIRVKVFTSILGKLNAAAAIRIVANHDALSASNRKKIVAAFEGINGELLEALTVFTNLFHCRVRPNGYWIRENGIAKDREDLWELAKEVGVDANQIAAKHFHDQGTIAPAADMLYPKSVKWPTDPKTKRRILGPDAKERIAEIAGAQPAKKAAKKAVAPAAKKTGLSAKAKKQIADAMKKRWAGAQKPAGKKAAKKAGRK
jgi:ParB/RepB/Spo0J family partition protein